MKQQAQQGNVVLIVVIAVAALALVGFIVLTRSGKAPTTDNQTSTSQTSTSKDKAMKAGEFSFANPKKSAHYESNTPHMLLS